jgi:hypothetical protein
MGKSISRCHIAKAMVTGKVLGPVLHLGAGIGTLGAMNGEAALATDQASESVAEAPSTDVVTGTGLGAPNPGGATVSMPNGNSFTTEPGQSYSVPVAARSPLPPAP